MAQGQGTSIQCTQCQAALLSATVRPGFKLGRKWTRASQSASHSDSSPRPLGLSHPSGDVGGAAGYNALSAAGPDGPDSSWAAGVQGHASQPVTAQPGHWVMTQGDGCGAAGYDALSARPRLWAGRFNISELKYTKFVYLSQNTTYV